jgi:DNA-binding transcriptional LysR family regulator
MLSWDDFRYVKAIADAGSLVEAAGALGLHHSTLFRRLGEIERQLGSRLFERSRAGYVPTEWGEQMIALAARMHEKIISFEHGITGQELRPSGELRITTTDVLLLYVLGQVLVGFRRAYPEIVLDIVVSNQRLSLSRRDAEVAIRTTYYNPDPAWGSKVARIPWAVFGPATLADQPFDPPVDAARHDWVAIADPGAVGRAMRWLRNHAGENRIVYKVDTMLGLAEAAAGGAGLVLLPCYVGDAVAGLARLTPPLPELERELWLLAAPELRETARVHAFLHYCGEAIARRFNAAGGAAN